MPRRAREKVSNSIYHICVRGNNKQDIFLDDKDRKAYMERLRLYKERYKMRVFSYCLMTNHVHLLIYDNGQDISKFMQGLSLSYVIYFNRRHDRTGHLFQDRFTSVLVKSDAQLIYVSKYIHLNPVKARMVSSAKDYIWSSYKAYLTGVDAMDILDMSFLKEIASDNVIIEQEEYVKYFDEQNSVAAIEETASALEWQDDVRKKLIGIRHLQYEEVYDKLHNTLYPSLKKDAKKVSIIEPFRESSIMIYLLGLISRLSWSQIAQKLNMSVNVIYCKIKKFTIHMVRDNEFRSWVDEIIYDL